MDFTDCDCEACDARFSYLSSKYYAFQLLLPMYAQSITITALVSPAISLKFYKERYVTLFYINVFLFCEKKTARIKRAST